MIPSIMKYEITHRIVLIDLGIYDVIPDARGNPIIVKVINSPVRSYIFIMYHSASYYFSVCLFLLLLLRCSVYHLL